MYRFGYTPFLISTPTQPKKNSHYKLSKLRDIDFLCVQYKLKVSGTRTNIHRDILTSVMTFVKYGYDVLINILIHFSFTVDVTLLPCSCVTSVK